jgi:adenosylcobinamide-phosphate synthase
MMKEFILFHIVSLGLGIILDQIIGDPHSLPHPIRAIGNFIAFLEKKLWDGRDAKKDKRKGTLLWLIVVLTVMAVTFCIIFISYRINNFLGILAETVLTCYILAARSLCRESMAVHRNLEKGDIAAARFSLSMIVGRDTDCLLEEEIAKAAVETVAENTSDGVIAPLLYTALGGPVLGMAYKAVNTMDSMLGYHNERYENFGFFAAKADDFFNYIPSRISALFMIAGSFLLKVFSKDYSAKDAFKIWIRDRYNHKSPNSAQTESVCAGALGLRLGGTHLYKGVPVEKPTIGDETRKTTSADIKRANGLMFMTEAVTVWFVMAILLTIYKVM